MLTPRERRDRFHSGLTSRQRRDRFVVLPEEVSSTVTNPSGVAALEEEAQLERESLPEPAGRQTSWSLLRLVRNISQSGNPDEDFFYLGGPMTNIAGHNFPRFHEIGDKLRAQDYNIVSPAELDDPETAEKYATSDGSPLSDEEYGGLVGRDLIVVSLPTCVGMICLEGWQHSRGAAAESWVITYLGKQLFEYEETVFGGKPALRAIDRDDRLRELGVEPGISGLVPTAPAGAATAAANGHA